MSAQSMVFGVVQSPVTGVGAAIVASGSNYNIQTEAGDNLVDESGNAIIQEESP